MEFLTYIMVVDGLGIREIRIRSCTHSVPGLNRCCFKTFELQLFSVVATTIEVYTFTLLLG